MSRQSVLSKQLYASTCIPSVVKHMLYELTLKITIQRDDNTPTTEDELTYAFVDYHSGNHASANLSENFIVAWRPTFEEIASIRQTCKNCGQDELRILGYRGGSTLKELQCPTCDELTTEGEIIV